MTAEECQSELIAYQEERLQYESAAKARLLRIFWKLLEFYEFNQVILYELTVFLKPLCPSAKSWWNLFNSKLWECKQNCIIFQSNTFLSGKKG